MFAVVLLACAPGATKVPGARAGGAGSAVQAPVPFRLLAAAAVWPAPVWCLGLQTPSRRPAHLKGPTVLISTRVERAIAARLSSSSTLATSTPGGGPAATPAASFSSRPRSRPATAHALRGGGGAGRRARWKLGSSCCLEHWALRHIGSCTTPCTAELLPALPPPASRPHPVKPHAATSCTIRLPVKPVAPKITREYCLSSFLVAM